MLKKHFISKISGTYRPPCSGWKSFVLNYSYRDLKYVSINLKYGFYVKRRIVFEIAYWNANWGNCIMWLSSLQRCPFIHIMHILFLFMWQVELITSRFSSIQPRLTCYRKFKTDSVELKNSRSIIQKLLLFMKIQERRSWQNSCMYLVHKSNFICELN